MAALVIKPFRSDDVISWIVTKVCVGRLFIQCLISVRTVSSTTVTECSPLASFSIPFLRTVLVAHTNLLPKGLSGDDLPCGPTKEQFLR